MCDSVRRWRSRGKSGEFIIFRGQLERLASTTCDICWGRVGRGAMGVPVCQEADSSRDSPIESQEGDSLHRFSAEPIQF